jgi:hypothetical protein
MISYTLLGAFIAILVAAGWSEYLDRRYGEDR